MAVLGMPSEERSLCTGVWIAQDKVLTAHHCLDAGVGYAFVSMRSEVFADAYHSRESFTSHLAAVLAEDEYHDLAILKVYVKQPHPVARLAAVDPRVGDFVHTVGHSKGLWWSYSTGVVAGFRDLDTGLILQTTVPTSQGNSGGGLFNARGELIGVTHGVVRDGQNLNLYIAPPHIRALLERVR